MSLVYDINTVVVYVNFVHVHYFILLLQDFNLQHEMFHTEQDLY